jgi:hypothetical protein
MAVEKTTAMSSRAPEPALSLSKGLAVFETWVTLLRCEHPGLESARPGPPKRGYSELGISC